MPIGNWNLQWLNHNSQRSYPLTERATKVDTCETIRIPDSFIVALYFPVHAGLAVAPEKFYIKSLLIAPTGFNISLGYNDGTNYPTVAAVNIARSAHVTNRAYALPGVDDFVDSVGHIVIGALDEIDLQTPGLYEFTPDAGELEVDAIRPMIRAVSALRAVNGIEQSARIYGDIELVAGTNMRLTVELSSNADPKIIFNAISGANLNADCICDTPTTGECIRCINGVCSGDGNFIMEQGSCVEITDTGSGLQLTDTCAEPCCGCEELKALETQVDRFGDGVNTLQNFVTRLGSEVTQMSLVVLGSRLGDSGCSTC